MSTTNRNRLLILLLLVISGIAYLYYKTLIFYEVVNGYSYDLTIYNSRPTIYTVKYYYKFEDCYYFDQQRYLSPSKAIPSSSAQVRVSKLNPSMNFLIENTSKLQSNYDFKISKPFKDTFDIKFKTVKDYYPANYQVKVLKNEKSFIYPTNIDSIECSKIIGAINRIVFCEGSIIEEFILNKDSNGFKLFFVCHYLNDFSTDSVLMSLYDSVIKESVEMPFTLYLVDKNHIREQKRYAT